METNTLTENGVSTTKGLGEEMYIKCCLGAYRGGGIALGHIPNAK